MLKNGIDTEALIQNANHQRMLVTAHSLLEQVLKEGGDMGTCEKRSCDLSHVVEAVDGFVAHLSLRECDLEEGIND